MASWVRRNALQIANARSISYICYQFFSQDVWAKSSRLRGHIPCLWLLLTTFSCEELSPPQMTLFRPRKIRCRQFSRPKAQLLHTYFNPCRFCYFNNSLWNFCRLHKLLQPFIFIKQTCKLFDFKRGRTCQFCLKYRF